MKFDQKIETYINKDPKLYCGCVESKWSGFKVSFGGIEVNSSNYNPNEFLKDWWKTVRDKVVVYGLYSYKESEKHTDDKLNYYFVEDGGPFVERFGQIQSHFTAFSQTTKHIVDRKELMQCLDEDLTNYACIYCIVEDVPILIQPVHRKLNYEVDVECLAINLVYQERTDFRMRRVMRSLALYEICARDEIFQVKD